MKTVILWAHSKLSHGLAYCGRWGHRPRRAAPVGVSTNRRQFGMHPNQQTIPQLF